MAEMYEDILHIIDLELDQLRRARHVLTAIESAPPAALVAAAAAVEEEKPAEQQEAQTVEIVTVPPARERRRRFARRPRQAAGQQPESQADAFGGVIPSRPVFVSAATVKAQATRNERPAPAAAPVPTEGTLDSLIRELTRQPSGDRSSSL